MEVVPYVRLYADAQGVSHFEEVAAALAVADVDPPAPPLQVASLGAAVRYGLLRTPAGWSGEQFHRSTARRLLAGLRGTYEVTAGDGVTRRFPPGSLLLLDDTTGAGHASRVIGDEPVLLLTVALAPSS